MPNNKASGMLEDLCLQSVNDHVLMPLVSQVYGEHTRTYVKRGSYK